MHRIDDHRTAALLDAARRAGSLSHPVFVRILDVGHDDDVAYVVEEDLEDASDLAQLVDEGGVPGDEVRRITGEVAAALESARHRGMHHLDLKPEDVLRTPDGDIRLRGLETAAVRTVRRARMPRMPVGATPSVSSPSRTPGSPASGPSAPGARVWRQRRERPVASRPPRRSLPACRATSMPSAG